MKINNTPYDILAKELSGCASTNEKAQIQEWLNSSPHAKDEYEVFAEIWQDRFFGEEDQMLINQEEVGNRIWEAAFEPATEKRTNWIRLNIANILKVAAVFIVIASVILVKEIDFFKATETNEVASRVIEKETLPGQKSTITLPDGSIVWLNSGSKISYSSNFGQENRDVHLTGQAFFDVFKNPKMPFVVDCRNVKVEAVGTSFDVDALALHEIQISLVTGKVKLRTGRGKNGEKNEMTLLPGQFSIVKGNSISDPDTFNVEEVLAWKNGKLIFHDLTLEEIIPTLELWYGVKIQNKTKLKKRKHFFGTFEKESLERVLHNVGLSMGFDYEFHDDIVILK